MPDSTIAGSTRSASDWFANIVTGFGEGLNKIGSDVLPNWTAQQLLDQKDDNLYTPTNYKIVTPDVATVETTDEATSVLFDINKIGTQITAGSLLVFLAIGVGGYLLWKKFM